MMVLRRYQDELLATTAMAYTRVRRVLMVSPTGSGKTAMFVAITQRAVAKGNRVYIVAHRQEIVEQISRALDGLGVRHGRIQPGHTMTSDMVQVAMVQTLARRLDRIPEPALLVVDEAHHAVAGTWAKLTEAWTRCRILGVTATPQRLDGRGLGAAFDEMVIGLATADLISQGFLAGYDYLAPAQVADLSSVATRMGDFATDELAAAMDKAVVTGDAVQHYARHLSGRPAIAFCVSIAHAEHVAEQFRRAGYRAASVDGKQDASVRRDRITSIGDERLQVLTSCDLISEGTDIPAVAGAILLRPTKSLSMFLQQIGRVLRLKQDGGRAMILDHVGNVHRHGMPDTARQWSLDSKHKKGRDAVPVSTCKVCYRVFEAAPGWKTDPCQGGDGPVDGCVMSAVAGAREPIEQVAGELIAVDAEVLAALKAKPLREILTGRETRAELETIRKAKGYATGWVWHVMKDRRAGDRARVAA